MTTQMNPEISTKLAAFSVALVMNLALIGGVAVLFDGKVHGSVPLLSAVPAAPVASAVPDGAAV